jgi:SAM-dependent methyltransferase
MPPSPRQRAAALPASLLRRLRTLSVILYRPALQLSALPLVRRLRCLQLRRLEPLAGGRPRGTPIVRHYWARFLERHRSDIRGSALEIGTTSTIRRYGGRQLERADALDLAAHSPEITVVADLSRADNVRSDLYDCFVNQFTMHVIYDVDSALYHSIRILKPGGVLLATFSAVDYYYDHGLDMGTGGTMFLYHWFTPIEVQNLFVRAGLDQRDYTISVFGNVFSRIAYEMNLSAEELTPRELDHLDPGYPVLICARVVKPSHWRGARPEPRDPWLPTAVPLRWDALAGDRPR